jgi:hypothetical protein
VSEYLWTDVRLRAIELFHNGPSAAFEQRVLDVFREHPALVVEAIEHVGRRFASGQVRSPWVILAKHVEEAMRPLEDVHVSDQRDQVKAISRAEQWMRAAGKHFDREDEILDALFGDFGRLKTWRDDEPLRQQMVKLWHEVRPEGELIEAQAIERAEHWKATTGLRWKLDRDPKFRAAYLTEHPDEDPEPTLDEEPEPALS